MLKLSALRKSVLPRQWTLNPRWSALLPPRQVVPRKIALLTQPALLPHKQLVLRQSALRQSALSQAVSVDPRAVSTSASQAGSYQEETSQGANTSSQTHSTNSQGASATLAQASEASRQPSSASSPGRSPKGNSLENLNHKWVINLSSKSWTQAQRSVLAKGPKFVVTPRHPPNLEYIMAIEAACTKLGQQDAEELRAEINRVLRSFHPPNLT